MTMRIYKIEYVTKFPHKYRMWGKIYVNKYAWNRAQYHKLSLV